MLKLESAPGLAGEKAAVRLGRLVGYVSAGTVEYLYSHADAVLRIARALGGPWRLLLAGYVLPRAWRDAAYRFVARHRYRWFGRQDICWLPTPDLKARFL